MAGFAAADAVGRLDWDFKPFVDAAGVVPEPSTDQAIAFQAALQDLTAQSTAAEAAEKLGQMTAEEMRAVEDKLLGAILDVCSNCPTREQIEGLPYRQRVAFFGYVTGQLLNPH